MWLLRRSTNATSPKVIGSPSTTGDERNRSAIRVCDSLLAGASAFHSGVSFVRMRQAARSDRGEAALGSRRTDARTTGAPARAAW